MSPVTWEDRVEKKAAQYVRLAYEEKGSGDVILLLHGFAESRFTWRYLAKDLAREYRVISLDLKGFGESPKPKDGRYSIYDQAMAVKHFIQMHRLQNVTLVGHSLGGGVALAVALMAEETEEWQVDRLILLGTAAYKQTLPAMLRNLNRPIIGSLGVYLIPAYYQARKSYEFAFYDDNKIPIEGVLESAKNFSSAASRYVFLQTARQLIPDDINQISRRYSTIKQPILLIWGEKDRIVPYRYGKRLDQALSHSHLSILPKVGHMVQEESPAEVLSLMVSFMQEHSGRLQK